jgi:hypothetical protein
MRQRMLFVSVSLERFVSSLAIQIAARRLTTLIGARSLCAPSQNSSAPDVLLKTLGGSFAQYAISRSNAQKFDS